MGKMTVGIILTSLSISAATGVLKTPGQHSAHLTLSEGVSLCVDTDECGNISTCSQTCTNTKGSYKCSCTPGYTVEGRHCRAGGEPPKLLYAVHSSINGVMMRPGSAYRVSMELTSHAVPIKSFSYNPTSHLVY